MTYDHPSIELSKIQLHVISQPLREIKTKVVIPTENTKAFIASINVGKGVDMHENFIVILVQHELFDTYK